MAVCPSPFDSRSHSFFAISQCCPSLEPLIPHDSSIASSSSVTITSHPFSKLPNALALLPLLDFSPVLQAPLVSRILSMCVPQKRCRG